MALTPQQTRGSYQSDLEQTTTYEASRIKPVIQPFAGRIGGNQEIVVDRVDPQNAELLKKIPDAAPRMSFREGTDLRGFLDLTLWKFGFIELIGGSGTFPLCTACTMQTVKLLIQFRYLSLKLCNLLGIYTTSWGVKCCAIIAIRCLLYDDVPRSSIRGYFQFFISDAICFHLLQHQR
jgi:hypothetical protein